MKRREFSLSTASAVAASALTLPMAPSALAQARQFKEGKDYKRLDKPVAPEAPAGKVDVIEFFWYSCSHCNAFEPTLDAWVKTASKDMAIRRVPVAFNASFVPQQKLFYALEGMGKLDEVHAKVFRAIHVEKQKLAKDDEIFAWIGKQGLDVVSNLGHGQKGGNTWLKAKEKGHEAPYDPVRFRERPGGPCAVR